MKKLSIITFLMLLMQVAIGQIQFNYDDTGNRVKRFSTNTPTYSLSVSNQTGLTNVIAAGGSNVGSFVVASTNVNWNISGVPSWATVSSNSGGNGNSTINVSFTANSTTSSRSVTLTVSGDNGVSSQTVSVSQLGTGGTDGGGCVVNKVRLAYRAWSNGNGCCLDRLIGSKIQGSNNGSNWTDLYVFNQSGNGTWQEFTINNTTSYTSVRFQGGSNSWGELSELEFYNGSTKLTGTAFGTESFALAFDGDINTGWHGNSFGSSNVAGLQLNGCSGGCTSPTPTITANPATGVPTTLTAAGCTGTVKWNDNSTGSTKTVSTAGTYTANCTNSECTTSGNGTITVSAGGGCVVNKVRLYFRTDCCSERLQGAKIQGSNDGNSWTDIYTFNQNAAGGWQDFTFTNSTSYTSVRFQAGPNGYGELAGLEFYNGTTKLSGTAIGSTGVANNDPNYSAVNMLNGAGYSFWHGIISGSSNYAGLQLSGCTSSGRIASSELISDFDTIDFGTDPNPSSGKVMVKFTGETGSVGSLIVHDMTGRTLLTDSIEANAGKLVELPNYFIGVSLFTLTTDTFIKTKKVMIVK